MQYRSGAELFVRDLALALHQRGHSIVVYAPILGDLAEELRSRCIACIRDLGQAAQPPDLIIGNTRDDTVACLAHFLGVPALFICHDRTAQHGVPPRFARIQKYVAVDENCAERLYLENSIERSSIDIVSNGVDLERFRPRAPLPAKPLRAAIFSNYATEGEDTAAIRAACATTGVALEVIGKGVGQQAAAPEKVLAQFDLVFAKARCAMEAMAVGCAVVLLNEGMGLAGMVTPETVQEWHRWNFGRRLMRQPIQPETIAQEIQRYSAQDAQVVASYVRAHVSLEATVNAMERLAKGVVRAWASVPPPSPEQELREFARHTADNLMPFGVAPVAAQTGILLARLERLEKLGAVETHYPALPAWDPAPPARALSVAHARLADLEQQIEALRGSWSWRLTAPLRWLGTHRRI